MKSPTEDCPPPNAEDTSRKGYVTWALIPKCSWWWLTILWMTSAYWWPWWSGQHCLELLHFRPQCRKKTVLIWAQYAERKLLRKPQLPMFPCELQTHYRATSSSVSGSHSCWVLSAPQFPCPIKQNSSWEGRQAGQTNCKVTFSLVCIHMSRHWPTDILQWYLVGYSTVKGYREETKVTTQRNQEHDWYSGGHWASSNFHVQALKPTH